jgi:cytochrome oxidase Cu insertion factor (SCO1/SenC/PrrC family)
MFLYSLLAFVPAIPSVGMADEDPHAKHRAMMQQKSEPTAESAEIDLRDRLLVDHNGQEVKFVTDVISDNIVVMDFVYTTCTTICPVLSALFTQVQQKLGDDVGADVRLVSMSVDPVASRRRWLVMAHRTQGGRRLRADRPRRLHVEFRGPPVDGADRRR